jgi:predicted DNA-binding transcriptional regulator AlpA
MEPLLDINDVERITKIKKATLRRYVLLKQIPYYKVIKAIRFKASEINAWVKNNGNLKGLKGRGGPLRVNYRLLPGKPGNRAVRL